MANIPSNQGLMAEVKNGVLDYKVSSEKLGKVTPRGSSELGKDAFLQLLVCQMQNQDPLEPNTDTEYVAQLAQFSQLEQLQNLSAESEKAQSFSLIGKYVMIKNEDTSGKTTYPEGIVDSVTMSGKDIMLSINGKSYKYSDLYQVISPEEVARKKALEEQQNAENDPNGSDGNEKDGSAND